MKEVKTMLAIDKIRRIIGWANYMNEDFNGLVRNVGDWEKLFDYAEKNRLEFIDNLLDENYYEKEEGETHMRAINKLLGYKLYQL